MLRHVALFRWKDDTTEEQIRQIRLGLAELPSLIDEVRDYQFGPDEHIGPAAAERASVQFEI